MPENTRTMMNAQQVSEDLGVSVSYAYKIIDRLNRELEKAGFLTIHGKVDSLYLSRRFFPSAEQIQSTSN
jgi:DNA-binding IscR family transcriptional regulator